MISIFLRDFITFIITLGILITIHEYGHFFAARVLNVKIERFSIGFGPVLCNWTGSDGTKYVISIILIGGYVKLYDPDIYEINNNKDNNNLFRYKNIWERACIIIAGPIFNFILSIILYTIVYSIGVPTQKPIAGYIIPNSLAYQSQISAGATIKTINNISVHNWDELRVQVLNNMYKEKITIATELVNSNNIAHLKNHIVYLPKNWFNHSVIQVQDPLITLGILPNVIYVRSIIPPNIQNDVFHEKDSLQINDKILLINQQPIYNWNFFVQTIINNSKEIFKITIDRNEQILHLDYTLYQNNYSGPKSVKDKINLFLDTVIISTGSNLEMYQYKLHTAILKACNKTWNVTCLIIHALFQLIFKNIGITNLHGPIAIAQSAGKLIHSGMIYYLMFLAMISINLGVINLLPFPILDGGHLLFLFTEKIIGNPISKKTQNFSYIISYMILILIMFITLYNDITGRI